jgi:hypothetical protein
VGRTLRYVGLIVLAGAAWALLAADSAFRPLSWVGAGSLGLGLLYGLLAPLGRRLFRGRCVRCGGPVERGQVYCLDHLRDTVNEYQDQMRRHDRY